MVEREIKREKNKRERLIMVVNDGKVDEGLGIGIKGCVSVSVYA